MRRTIGALLLAGAVLLALGWWMSGGSAWPRWSRPAPSSWAEESTAGGRELGGGAAGSLETHGPTEALPKGGLALVGVLAEQPGEQPAVCALCISPDGTAIAAANGSGTLRLWNIKSRNDTKIVVGEPVISLAWSPDSAYVAAGSDSLIFILSVASGRVETERPRQLTGNQPSQGDIAFSPDGRHLYAGAGHENVDAWDLLGGGRRTLHGVEPVDGQWEGPIRSSPVGGSTTDRVVVGPDGTWLVAGDWTYPLRVIDTDSGQLLRILRGHEKHLVSMAVSPDGRQLVSSSGDAAFVWRTDTWERSALGAPAAHLGWSLDSAWIFSADVRDHTLRVWDARSCMLRDSVGTESEPTSLAVREGIVAVGCSDGTIRLYEHRP
jgi:WD40 repeat protein